MNTQQARQPTTTLYIAWSHWACTPAAWQNFFRSEDEDPALKL